MANILLPIDKPALQPDNTPHRNQRHGILWIIGSFAICPCHLPLTLGLLATLLGGTAFGAVFVHNLLLAGIGTTILWAAGTWYGFSKLRSTTCAIKPKPQQQGMLIPKAS